jgi:hypothetical protein
MATGDQNDLVVRLRSILPSRWFPDTSPALTAVLSGFGYLFACIYSLLKYANLQTRIGTATDAFLDMISADYFGLGLPRRTNEADVAFSARIKAALLGPKVTRAAVISALVSLTGRTPTIFEPANTGDTGAYGSATATTGTGLAYNTVGGYGSLMLPFQFFLTAYRPITGGIASVAGYYTGSGWAGGGYGVGAIEYATLAMSTQVTDAQIQNAVNTTRPVASTAWMRIES